MKLVYGTLVPFLLAALCTSCDMITLNKPKQPWGVPPVEPVPASDAGFSSFSGEREKTYVLAPDTNIGGTMFTFTVSGTFNYGDGSNHPLPQGQGTNSATVTLPFKALYAPGSYTISAKGTMGARYEEAGVPTGTESYVSFTNTKSVYLDLSATNQTVEEYGISETFASSSLALPLKGYTVDPNIVEFRTKQFALRLNRDQFWILANPYTLMSPTDRLFGTYGGNVWGFQPLLPTAVSAPAIQYTAPYRPASRDFYRYRSFTIAYPAGVKVFGVEEEPIVSSYTVDEETNTINASFADYNAPYTGTVLRFWIQAEDGTVVQKTITIE